MAKRKGVGPRARFEVFKRDGFACQYCGRTPPAAILEIDHILAVSRGGSDDEANLLTSCFDCNRGKSDVPLEQVPRPLADQMQERIDRAEQVKAYNRFLLKLRRDENAAIDRIQAHWFAKFNETSKEFSDPARASIKTFLQSLPELEVIDSIDIAWRRKNPRGAAQRSATWLYFCGICWSKIKGGRNG